MATIASAQSHTPPAFNATFYATVAVIIPVLYLALVVRGGGADTLLQPALAVLKSIYKVIPAVKRGLIRTSAGPEPTAVDLVIMTLVFTLTALTSVIFSVVLITLSCLIAVAGGVAELCALYALYKQDADISIPPDLFGPNPISVNVSYIVLAGTGILIAATTILPFAQLFSRVRVGEAELPTAPPDEDKSPLDESG